MRHVTKKAIILGWYGSGNVGDELLASHVVRLLEGEGYQSCLISVDPDYSRRVLEHAEFIKMYDWAAIAREMASADLFVIGGGGVFQEYDSFSVEGLYEFPARSVSFYAQTCLLARQFGLRSVYLAQGIGPLFSTEAKAIVRDLFQHADVVSVRDDASARLLREIGVSRELIVAPDLIWARDNDKERAREKNSRQKIVAVVVRHWAQDEENWMQGVDGALRLFHNAGWLIRFVNFGSSADALTISDLASHFPDSSYEILDASVSPSTAQTVLSTADVALVMRMHALILAAQAQVPVVAIAYDAKIVATAEWIGLPEAFRVLTSSPAKDFEAAAALLLTEETAKGAIGSPKRLAELSRRASRHAEALSEGVRLPRPSEKIWRAERFDWLSAWFAEREVGRAATLRNLRYEAQTQKDAAKVLELDLRQRIEAADAKAAEAERENERLTERSGQLKVQVTQLEGRLKEMVEQIEEQKDRLEELQRLCWEHNARAVETERENLRLTERSGQLEVQVTHLQGQLKDMVEQIEENKDRVRELERLRWEHNDATYLLSAMKNSTSWKVTAPLRAMSRVVATLGRRRHSNGARIAFIAGLIKKRGMRETIAWVRARLSDRAEALSYSGYAPSLSESALKPRMSRSEFLNMIRKEQSKGRLVYLALPTIDWNVPLYQRPQHMAAAMARGGAIVVYATFNMYDNVDGYQKVIDNVWVTNDIDVFTHIENSFASVYSTAYALESDFVARIRSKNNLIVYEYIDHIDEAISGSENVEKLKALKGIYFGNGSDIVVASSKVLFDEATDAIGADKVCFVPNGVDLDHYVRAKAVVGELPSVMAEFAPKFRHVVGYFGALAPWIWHEMLNDLTQMRPDLGFVFIGPDYYGGMANLERRENVLLTGPVPYLDLPSYATRFDVSIIPFRPGEIARTTSPLKLFEYFALGTPVVVTDEMHECTVYPEVFSAGNVASFSSALDIALAMNNDKAYKARLLQRALENTWDQRAKVLLSKVEETRAARRSFSK